MVLMRLLQRHRATLDKRLTPLGGALLGVARASHAQHAEQLLNIAMATWWPWCSWLLAGALIARGVACKTGARVEAGSREARNEDAPLRSPVGDHQRRGVDRHHRPQGFASPTPGVRQLFELTADPTKLDGQAHWRCLQPRAPAAAHRAGQHGATWTPASARPLTGGFAPGRWRGIARGADVSSGDDRFPSCSSAASCALSDFLREHHRDARPPGARRATAPELARHARWPSARASCARPTKRLMELDRMKSQFTGHDEPRAAHASSIRSSASPA